MYLRYAFRYRDVQEKVKSNGFVCGRPFLILLSSKLTRTKRLCMRIIIDAYRDFIPLLGKFGTRSDRGRFVPDVVGWKRE